MALTATPPPPNVLDVDAGVVEEARRRQQRHRGRALAAVLATANGMFLVGGSCLHTNQATLIAAIVPDRVASITLRYPSITVTAAVVNNVVVASVPHPGSPLWRPISMIWRTANGHIIKTFNGL